MKIKRNYLKWILKILGIAALTIYCYLLAHEAATAERGYDAVGGELCAFLIPYFIWLAPKLKETTKAVKGDNENK